MNKIKLKVIDEKSGERLDKILSEMCKSRFPEITRTRIQDSIKNGNLTKDNKIFIDISYRVKTGDEFVFEIPDIEEKILKPTKIPLNIVYEDDDLIVVNKQAGLTTHPGAGNDENTLANALLELYGDNLSKVGGDFRPGIVHRLDKDTSGLIVVAKNDEAHLKLSEQLQNRALDRNYIGFLWGVLSPKSGYIEGYIERSKHNRTKMEMTKNEEEGRYSLTNYKTLEIFLDNSISMVEFKLSTGRTHQIRVHCSSEGHPLIGDYIYGGKSRHLKNIYKAKTFIDEFPRQALHSYKISFNQPTTGKFLEFEIPLADDLKLLYEKLTEKKPVNAI